LKKVCHISSVHDVLDVRIMLKECMSLAASGFDVTYLCEGTLSLKHGGVRIIGIPNMEKGRYKRMIKFASLICDKALELKADIYHLHDPELLQFVEKLKSNGAKVIYDAHEELPEQIKHKEWVPSLFKGIASHLTRWYEHKALKKVSHIICVSPLTQQRYSSNGFSNTLISNYPMLKEFELTSLENERVDDIVYIGGLFKSRGLFEMMKVAALLNVRLHLAGKFEDEATQLAAQTMEEWKQVYFHGMLDRKSISILLSKCKVGLLLLHPHKSFQNAYPVKLFEYMAAGLPVVCSNFSLWEQMLEEDRFGESCNPLIVHEIATKVKLLLSDKELWTQYSEKGKTAVQEKYHWEKESDKLLKVYASL